MSRFLKFLHELASYGLAGGFGVQLFLLAGSESIEPATQTLIHDIGLWIVAPSLTVVIASGLLAMVVRPVFFRKGWVWMKILLTAPTFYVTLVTLPGVSNLPWERVESGLWLAMAALVVITALSVWRWKHLLIAE